MKIIISIIAETMEEKKMSKNFDSLFENFSRDINSMLSVDMLKIPFHEVEKKAQDYVRKYGCELMKLNCAGREQKFFEKIVVKEDNLLPRIHTPTRTELKQHVSVFGKFYLSRTAYTNKGHFSVFPLDEELQLPTRSFSYFLQYLAINETIRGSYDEASDCLSRTIGINFSKRTLEQISNDWAHDFDDFYCQRAYDSHIETGSLLVLNVDCKGIPIVKEQKDSSPVVRLTKGIKRNRKKMATVATVHTQQPRFRAPEEVINSLFKRSEVKDRFPKTKLENKRVWASLKKSKKEVFNEAYEEFIRRDPKNNKQHVILSDGEVGLQNLARKTLPNAILILDFIHAIERIWIVAHALFGEGTEEAVNWAYSQALSILRGNVKKVVATIRHLIAEKKLSKRKKCTMEIAAKYLDKNSKYMNYNEYLKKGYPIASGVVEGACKHLVKDRMELSGMRWTIEGAEAILKLRAVKISGDMNEYLQFHIEKEQVRKRGNIEWEELKEAA